MKKLLPALITLLWFSSVTFSQTGTITTYVGPPPLVEGSLAVEQSLRAVADVVSDGTGGFYFSSSSRNTVYRVTADGRMRTVAGTTTSGFSGDGGAATSAQLNDPRGLARDSAGNLYIADSGNLRVRKVNTNGVISTVAGNGTRPRPGGSDGDGEPATSARVSSPAVIAVGGNEVYLSDTGKLRKINAAGIITTIAGTGTSGFSGDGGPAIAAQVSNIRGIAIDVVGNIFISEATNQRVRKITTDGIIVTVAGTGTAGFSGDGGAATSAELNRPSGIAVDGGSNVYVADAGNLRIRRVAPSGKITTIAGTGEGDSTGDGGAAILAHIGSPLGLTLDTAGNLYFTSSTFIRRIDAAGVISTVAGSGVAFSGDGGPATTAQLNSPSGIVVDAAGNLYIADSGNNRIRRVTPGGLITTVAGTGVLGFAGDGGLATSAQLDSPGGIAIDKDGNLYIADVGNHRIRRVSADGIISTVAGSGEVGNGGDGGPATSAKLNFATDVAVDRQGNLYIADEVNQRIRKVTFDGIITTFAGTGTSAFSGDFGPATEADLSFPAGVKLDAQGNVYISDANNLRIRRVSTTGIITTVAGGGSDPIFIAPTATSALIGATISLAIDLAGNIYIARGCDVLKVDTGGILTRIAGSACGFSGDGGPAISALLGVIPSFVWVAVDSLGGNLFIGDPGNERIRRVQLTQQVRYAVPDRGGMSAASSGTRTTVSTGYGRIRGVDSATPSGVAIYGFRSGNYLVSETGVPASRAIISGRIHAEIHDSVNTGLAIVNPNGQTATLQFFYTDTQGNDIGAGSTTIPPGGQIAKFMDAPPFKTVSGATFNGTLTFTSNVPVSAIAIRSFYNDRRDFLMSTLPVVDLQTPVTTETAVIPHFAAGGDWSTQLLLVNPTEIPLTGAVEFRDDNGSILNVSIAGQSSSSYAVSPRSSQRLTVTATTSVSGSVRVIPSGGSVTPVPLVVFSYIPGGLTVSEAGVPATQGTAFRLYAETSSNIQTAIAIANRGSSTASVMVELFNLDGTSTGLPAPVVLTLAPFGHSGKFLSQIFQGASLPNNFKGIVRVSTASAGIAVTELRTHYNERSDFLITTLPATDESALASSEDSFFPQVADGGNYTMQFVLFNSRPGATAGTLLLFSPSGETLDVPLQ